MALSRRNLLALAGAGSLATMLSSCAGRLEPADISAAGFGEGAEGTLSVWCRSETQTGIQTMVDAFHSSQDRIRVELTPVLGGQYVTKLATAIRGGRVPDLVDIDDINSALFIYRDAFTDLTPLIDAIPDRDRLSPGHLALAARDGKYYGAPFLADNSVLWCNSDLFDRAGVDLEETTASFEGYLEAARAISALDPETYGWTYPGNSAGALGFVVQPHIWAADTDLIAGEIGAQRGNVEGNGAVRSTLELLRTLWDEQLVPPASFSDDASRWGTDFLAGKVGMIPSAYGTVVLGKDPEFLKRVEVRVLAGPEGGRAFFDGGDNLCIPNGSRNASAAWEFIRFCLAVPQQATLPAGGFTPIRADVADDAFRAAYPLATAPLEQLEAGYAPLTLSYNRIYNQSDGPWLEMFRRAVFDGQTDEAMAAAQMRYDQILQQGDA